MGKVGLMYIESPFGEYADDAVIRLTMQEVLALKHVPDRMLGEGPSVDLRAHVPSSTTSDQIAIAWDMAHAH